MKSNKKKLPVSIILPTYNRLFVLKKMLPEYLALPVEEVIVVNDASNDGTMDYLDSITNNRLKVVHHKIRKYLPAARNSGINIASQPYILMGEDDVIMNEDYVETLFREIKEFKADIIAGRLIALEKNETTQQAFERVNNNPPPQLFYPERLSCDFSYIPEKAIKTPMIHACSLFKTEWAKNYPYCEDYRGNALREESHFYFTCLRNGAEIFFTPSAVAFHMYHDYAGGCRGNQFLYLMSSIKNTHRFLNCFWRDLKQLPEINFSRISLELHLIYNSTFNTLAHTIRTHFPRVHRFLKRKKD
jgi:glycosyltransferase involved in cell wall biosynthesis